MAYTLAATACPTPISPAAVATLNAENGTPLVGEAWVAGQTSGLVSDFNENGARLDLVSRFGGGAYAILKGLSLAYTTAGFIDIATGQAMVDGVRELTVMTQKAVTNSVRNYAWMQRSGVAICTTSTTPPSSPSVFLGSFLVNGSGVCSSIDYSGVFYLMGGIPVRNTSDTTVPVDTPPATMMFLHLGTGTGKTWFWNGVSYLPWASIVVPTANTYTQTYATADRTHANPTSADLTGISSSTTGSALVEPGAAYVQAEQQQNFRRIQDQFVALRADLLDLKQFANGIVDDLQTAGILP